VHALQVGGDRPAVESVVALEIASDRAQSPERESRAWRTESRRKAVAVGLLVLAVALGVGVWFAVSRATPFDKARIKSVAVLPFKRLDNVDDNERLGIGMADTLITRLSNIQALTVRSTRDVMRYEDGAQDLAAAGNDLGVDAILDGSIQQSGDRVRVTVRLIHTATNAQIWAAQFDERLSDIFTMQDAISAQVVGSLSLSLTDVERQRLSKNYTEDIQAYEAYLKGRYFLNRRARGDVGRTIEHFEEAIRLSPDYALAYAGLADAYATRAYRARTSENRSLSYNQAKLAALKAIEIDDRLAEARASLGFILRDADWDWIQSEKTLKQAIELNPNYAPAHHYYALLLATLGRLDEALSEIATAQRLDPLSLVINADLAAIHIFARRPQRAIEIAKKALEMDNRFTRLQFMLIWAYLDNGQYEDAIREARNVSEVEGSDAIFPGSIMGCAYAASGQRQKAAEMAQKLSGLTSHIAPALVQTAAIYSVLGEKGRAFELLRKAAEVRDDRLLWLKVDRRFDGLRSDPQYGDLLRRMNLPN
jgi:TolB-like protein/Flp pilus assembly protein TadD